MSREAFDYWGREHASKTYVNWRDADQVRRYVNRLTSSDENVTAVDWLEQRAGRKFERALSIGCGAGSLERDLIRRELCQRIDAFDGSLASVAIARSDADAAGYGDRIRYFAADFNVVLFPRGLYDAVFVNQALHHVEELEHLYAVILEALKQDGFLYLDEFVGPSRFDWNDLLIAPHREIYDALPPDCRLQNPLMLPIHASDPSEAVRSSEILDLLAIGFDVIERRDYGGNLVSVLFPAIDWDRAPDGLLGDLIEREEKLLSEGAESYSTVILARPKRAVTQASSAYRRRRFQSRVVRRAMRAVRTVDLFRRRVIATLRRRYRDLRSS